MQILNRISVISTWPNIGLWVVCCENSASIQFGCDRLWGAADSLLMTVIHCWSWANVLSNFCQEHTILLRFLLYMVRRTFWKLWWSHVASWTWNLKLIRKSWIDCAASTSNQWAFRVPSSACTLTSLYEFSMRSCPVIWNSDGIVIILLDCWRFTSLWLKLSNSSLNTTGSWSCCLNPIAHVSIWSSRSHSETASSWSRSSFLNNPYIYSIELISRATMSSSLSLDRILPRIVLVLN